MEEAVALEVEPMEMQEVYEHVERATGMHNGRLARVFRRAVGKAVRESRAAAGALTQPSSGLFATECHTPDSLHACRLASPAHCCVNLARHAHQQSSGAMLPSAPMDSQGQALWVGHVVP